MSRTLRVAGAQLDLVVGDILGTYTLFLNRGTRTEPRLSGCIMAATRLTPATSNNQATNAAAASVARPRP